MAPASQPPGHETDDTSASLIVRVRRRDEAAWHRLVDLYTPLVCHWCRRAGLDAEEAGDAAQDVFLAVSRHLEEFRHEQPGDTFRGWLRVIARNKIRDAFRRRQRQVAAAGGTDAHRELLQRAESLPEESSEEGTAEEKNLLLRRALELVQENFEPVTWQAFYRVVVDGRSPAEVAVELRTTAGAVRQAKYKVLRKLRLEMGELLE